MARTKTTLQKVNQDEKEESNVPDESERYLSPQKKTKCSGERQPSRKRILNNDSEDDPESGVKNGEDARNVYQRPRRTKAKTNRDEQYTRRNL